MGNILAYTYRVITGAFTQVPLSQQIEDKFTHLLRLSNRTVSAELTKLSLDFQIWMNSPQSLLISFSAALQQDATDPLRREVLIIIRCTNSMKQLQEYTKIKNKLFTEFDKASTPEVMELKLLIEKFTAQVYAKTYLFILAVVQDDDTVLQPILNAEDSYEHLQKNLLAYQEQLTDFNDRHQDKIELCDSVNNLLESLDESLLEYVPKNEAKKYFQQRS